VADLKLGKLPATEDHRDIKYTALLEAQTAPLPQYPKTRPFGHGLAFTNWGMLANDQLGDCVAAWMCHATMLWTKLGDPATATFTDADAIKVYSQVAGYVPGDPSTDQGTDMRVAMGSWRNTGIKDSSGKTHRIGAYLSVPAKDTNALLEAAYLFGCVAIGFEFPDYAMDQFNQGQKWDVEPGGQIEGGHCVGITGRISTDNMGCITWGARQGMTPAFYEKYNDETWVAVSADELKAGKNERGLDLTTLTAALHSLGIGV